MHTPELARINDELIFLLTEIDRLSQISEPTIDSVSKEHRFGALNLIQYLVVHDKDLRRLTHTLRKHGLSSLDFSENHVADVLQKVQHHVADILGTPKYSLTTEYVHSKTAKEQFRLNEARLLGRKNKHRNHVMVTFALNQLVNVCEIEQMIEAGADSFRLNFSYGTTKEGYALIAKIKEAAANLNSSVKIVADLSGNKLRLQLPQTLLHIRREWSNPVLFLAPGLDATQDNIIPLSDAFIAQIQEGDLLSFTNKQADKVEVLFRPVYSPKQNKWMIFLTGELVLSYDATFTLVRNKKEVDKFEFSTYKTDKAAQQRVFVGDNLIIAKSETDYLPLKNEKVLYCSSDELYGKVRKGTTCFLDDGKVKGKVVWLSNSVFSLEISQSPKKGLKLKNGKGLNVPGVNFINHGYQLLEDKKALKLLPYVDAVCFSFLKHKQELKHLLAQLKELNLDKNLGVILKVETRAAYDTLPEILLAAMAYPVVGVMIARGDLSLECGWENLALIQEDIHRISRAAFLPDIWATQVLDNLAKRGVPSRSEMSDVHLAQKSACIMLNKGPYIIEAIKMLHKVSNKELTLRNIF